MMEAVERGEADCISGAWRRKVHAVQSKSTGLRSDIAAPPANMAHATLHVGHDSVL